jgi:hypothetical protein
MLPACRGETNAEDAEGTERAENHGELNGLAEQRRQTHPLPRK